MKSDEKGGSQWYRRPVVRRPDPVASGLAANVTTLAWSGVRLPHMERAEGPSPLCPSRNLVASPEMDTVDLAERLSGPRHPHRQKSSCQRGGLSYNLRLPVVQQKWSNQLFWRGGFKVRPFPLCLTFTQRLHHFPEEAPLQI
jgi:hypothetical protein